MSITPSQICCNPECQKIANLEEQNKCMRCGRCRVALYCSDFCQYIHWEVHKQVCKPPAENSISTEGPFVLLLSLSCPDMLANTHGQFISALRSKVRIIQALDAPKALEFFADTKLIGVVVTDEGIAEAENSKVLLSLVKWVKAGGIAILGCLFSNFISWRGIVPFFQKWGLPWTLSAYTTTTNVLNPLIRQSANLAPSYTTKALHLKDVKVEDVLYAPAKDFEDEDENDDSAARLNEFPTFTVDLSNVPLAYTGIGKGYLGYVGDVNEGEESTNVMLAMLRL